MTDHAGLLKQIRADARPYIEQALDLAEVFTGFRKLASENGLDWGVIKALVKAEIQDEKEGGSLKVDRIIEKADFASAYADMLGLGSNMNENNFSSDTPEQSGTAREAPSQSRDTVRCSPREGEGASVLSPISLTIGSQVPQARDGRLTEEETDDAEGPIAASAGVFSTAKSSDPVAPIPIVSPPQTIAAVVASTSRDAPAASHFPELPKFLERRIA